MTVEFYLFRVSMYAERMTKSYGIFVDLINMIGDTRRSHATNLLFIAANCN